MIDENFAIIKTGGKQYCVKPGDVVRVEKIDAPLSGNISISEVLLLSSNGKVDVGTPTVSGAIVNAEIMRHVRSSKIIVFKKKRRHNYRRKAGHRQWMTVLKIRDVLAQS